jgi:hypothetical protein
LVQFLKLNQSGLNQSQRLAAAIDPLVYQLYGLTAAEIAVVANCYRGFN